ncbi:hypothetical protein BU17DRAFT_42505, partial [Hysterangium stoloniferum]
SFIYHPTGVIVEFPEAAAVLKGSVAHFFPVNSENYIDPKENIQYSLGGQHGGRENIKCHMLHDRHTGESVFCSQLKIKCKFKF